jgi:glycosyltransferase involved in cell wall biosynthesis
MEIPGHILYKTVDRAQRMNRKEDRDEPNSITPLKVLVFTETYLPVMGGGETQAQLLAESLIAKGHSVTLLTRRSDRSLPKFERLGAVPVYRLPPVGSGQLKKWGLAFSCIPSLIRLQKSYDIIFVSGFRIIGMTAVIMSKLMRKKCILKADSQGEMSGDFFIDGLKKFGVSPNFLPFKLFLSVRNSVLRKADAFSAISGQIAEELSANKVPAAKIIEIPNSVDTSRFYPVSAEQKSLLRKKLAIPETATIVVYTGRLVSYKGLPLLLKVWRDIHSQNQDSKLYLLGTGGMDIHNCEEELHAFTKANGLEQSVCFTGSVQNVPEYLQAADIFAFPTENDAFPSSLVEAMTCALPVITTPVGAIKSIIRDHQNGLMIQPGNEQQLYEALDRLFCNPELAGELGQTAWKTVQENYSAEIVTERYLTLFQKTIA